MAVRNGRGRKGRMGRTTHRAGVTTDAAPVVDEADEDEDDDHDNLDHGEPVLRLA